MTTEQLATYGTEITSVLVGKRTKVDDGQEWTHYLWTVTLTRAGKTRDIPYRMGEGHVRTKCGRPYPGRLGRFEPAIPCSHVRCNNAGWVPAPPTLYDVLTSLKADDTQGRTFNEWAGDYGMDTDSVKARDLYFRCQQSEFESAQFFGSDWALIKEDEAYQ